MLLRALLPRRWSRGLGLLRTSILTLAALAGIYFLWQYSSTLSSTIWWTPPKYTLHEALDQINNLRSRELKLYSQNGEDGITRSLLKFLGGPRWWYYVEFGVEAGVECNTRVLWEADTRWRGLLMDQNHEASELNLHKDTVYWSNVVSLFTKYQVPQHFDVLSVDTDFMDYWILLAILQGGYRPRIIVVEVNSFLGPVEALTVPQYPVEASWDQVSAALWKNISSPLTYGAFQMSDYFGFSVAAAWQLARRFSYSLVYCESRGVNCFLIDNTALSIEGGEKLSDYFNSSKLWVAPKHLQHLPRSQDRAFVKLGT